MASSSSNAKLALIVDDGGVERVIHAGFAKQLGFTASTVKNGKEAVDLHEAGARFDLIIMDMEMPTMNGIEATRKLRSMGVDCTITGATSCEDDSMKKIFKEAGLNHLIKKPVTRKELAGLIN